MYDEILFPIDDSEGATAVFDHVVDLAATHGATLHLLNVADTSEVSLTRIQGDVVDTLEPAGERIVNETADRAQKRGVSTVTEVVQSKPYSAILEYTELYDIDLVVMPTHGRQGLDRFLVGSTTERVVRRSAVPVLTIRWDDGAEVSHPYQTVLVAIDGSPPANRALEEGVNLAETEEAAIHVLSVVSSRTQGFDESDGGLQARREQASDVVDNAVDFAENVGIESTTGTVVSGSSIHEEILSYVDQNEVDLVVVGTHGRSGIDRYLLGSVAERLVRTSSVPVMTVRDVSEDS